jgi:hypothetical protein
MAHVDRMVMVHVWGMCEEQNSKRAQKNSNKAPREPMDAMCQMGLKWLSEPSPYSYAAGKWMFEHRKAVSTPLGGGTIAHSLIRPAHLAP